MSLPDTAASLHKELSFETGSQDKENDPEKTVHVEEQSGDDAAVGWNEFSRAKDSGLRVTREQSRR